MKPRFKQKSHFSLNSLNMFSSQRNKIFTRHISCFNFAPKVNRKKKITQDRQ